MGLKQVLKSKKHEFYSENKIPIIVVSRSGNVSYVTYRDIKIVYIL